METKRVAIQDHSENVIENSRALVWGNNAAWICTGCGQLLGNRTGDADYQVQCDCGLGYEILRRSNKSGDLNLGSAVGVRKI